MSRPSPTTNNNHDPAQQKTFKVRRFFHGKQSRDFPAQVMLLGDSGVGKTCLLVRFKDDTFLTGSFIATVGIDFRNKMIVINDKQVKLQIYDTVSRGATLQS